MSDLLKDVFKELNGANLFHALPQFPGHVGWIVARLFIYVSHLGITGIASKFLKAPNIIVTCIVCAFILIYDEESIINSEL